MKLLTDIDKILENLNKIRNSKKIGIEHISTYINKDKSVTSRILSGKYNLDLMTFINICYALEENPVNVLNECLNPEKKIIMVSDEDTGKFNELVRIIQGYIDK